MIRSIKVKSLKKSSMILAFIGCAATALIIRSLIIIKEYYFRPLFNDEWDLVLWLAAPHQAPLDFLRVLFSHWNEHVIVTTKLLLLADAAFFHLSNWPVVAVTVISNLAIVWILAKPAFGDRKYSLPFWAAFLVFSVAALSIAQWETLLWAFAVQIPLALLSGAVSIVLALEVATQRPTRIPWLAGLVLAMGFGIFSMSNGIAIPIAVLMLFVLLRAPSVTYLVTASFGAAYTIAYFLLPNRVQQIGHVSPRSPSNIAHFFFAMLGAPFSDVDQLSAATTLGVLLFAILFGTVLFSVILPWLRGKALDEGLVGLTTFAAFLLISAAFAAYGRCVFGLGIALEPRYATVSLLAWATLFLIIIRATLIYWPKKSEYKVTAWIAAAFLMSSWSTLRPQPLRQLQSFSNNMKAAAYFVTSGAPATSELTSLYPRPTHILPDIPILRAHRLNIFFDRSEFSAPPATLIDGALKNKGNRCPFGWIDAISDLDGGYSKIVGWVSDKYGRTPRLVFATDPTGLLYGFTSPTNMRSDVKAAIRAKNDFLGFTLPIHSEVSVSDVQFITAVGRDGDMCRLYVKSSSQ